MESKSNGSRRRNFCRHIIYEAGCAIQSDDSRGKLTKGRADLQESCVDEKMSLADIVGYDVTYQKLKCN